MLSFILNSRILRSHRGVVPLISVVAFSLTSAVSFIGYSWMKQIRYRNMDFAAVDPSRCQNLLTTVSKKEIRDFSPDMTALRQSLCRT